MKKFQRYEDVDPSQMFYVSWGDLVALLLVFFIYLYSISEIDVTKFLEATESFRTQHKFEFENRNLSDDLSNRIQAEQDQLKYLHGRVQFLIEEEMASVKDSRIIILSKGQKFLNVFRFIQNTLKLSKISG